MPEWSKETFSKNLKYYMEKKDINQKELSEIVGVSAPTVNNWIQAVKYPRIDKIEIMANYFGILKSDLIEERTDEQRKAKEKNDILTNIVVRLRTDNEFADIITGISQLNEIQLASVKQVVEAFLSE